MMRVAPLDFQKLRNLITEVEANLKALTAFSSMSAAVFSADRKNYGLAEHHLRRALEGVLTISTHILSRLPVKTKDYQEVITTLGEQGVVPKEFAERNKKLAGYRNRLVHMYWEVSPEELYTVIIEHNEDITAFCGYFRAVLAEPEKFGLQAA